MEDGFDDIERCALHTLRDLENADIPVRIDNETVSAVYSIDGMAPRVLVPASFAEQARQVIQEMRQASTEHPDDWDEGEEEIDDEASLE